MCRLPKAIHGLKESPGTWFVKFSEALIRFDRAIVNFITSYFFFYKLSHCILLYL